MTATLAKTVVATLVGGFNGLAVLGSDLYALSGNTLYKLVGSSFVPIAAASVALSGPLVTFGSTLVALNTVDSTSPLYKWDLGANLVALTAPASVTPYTGLEFGGSFYFTVAQGAGSKMYKCDVSGAITLAWALPGPELPYNPLVSFGGNLYHINYDGTIWLQSAGSAQVATGAGFWSSPQGSWGPITIQIGGILFCFNTGGSFGRLISWNGAAASVTVVFGPGAIPRPAAVIDYAGAHYIIPYGGNILLWDGAGGTTDTGLEAPNNFTFVMATSLGGRTFLAGVSDTTLYELAPVTSAAQPGMFIPVTIPGMS